TSLIGAFVTTGVAAGLHVLFGFAAGSAVGSMMYAELAVVAALVWASLPLLQHDPKRSTVLITCVVLGAVAGLQLLVKLNTGVAILAFALAVSVLSGWKAIGRHCATLAAFAVSIVICWVLAGQHLGDLPAWLRFSAAVASGYSNAMAIP